MGQRWSNLGNPRVLRGIAACVVSLGLVLGIGVTWQWMGRVRHISAEQVRLEKSLSAQWSVTRVSRVERAATGSPIARLHLPTIGQSLVVVEGADEPQLDKGPGRMVDTTPLGSRGNTALAGHRYPGVFWNLDRVEEGDPVVVETAGSWLVYRTVRTVIVQPVDEAVLAPPAAGAPSILTLITCEPKLSTAQRLIKQAELVRTDPKPGPEPRELKAETRR
jgi:sortase A